MAANYWDSTQRRNWQFTKEQLASMRLKVEEDNAELVRMYPLPQPRHLFIFFNQRALSRAAFCSSDFTVHRLTCGGGWQS